ncbi:MAG: hypothetical protein ACK5Q5_18070 [Planctomycetaceae bacterium]
MHLLIGRLLLGIILLGTVGSTLRAYPHQLAYFNEVAGWTDGQGTGPHHLAGSSFDLGQDMKEIIAWQSTQQNGNATWRALTCVDRQFDVSRFGLAAERLTLNDFTTLGGRQSLVPQPGYYVISTSLKSLRDPTFPNDVFLASQFSRHKPVFETPTINVFVIGSHETGL